MGQLVLEGPAAFPIMSVGISGLIVASMLRDFTDMEVGENAPLVGFAAGAGGVAFLIFAADNYLIQ